MTFSKGSCGDALGETHGSQGGGRSGRHVQREPTAQVLCPGIRFLMACKQVLNPCVFNNKHVCGGAFHTLLVEACPSNPMTDIPVLS